MPKIKSEANLLVETRCPHGEKLVLLRLPLRFWKARANRLQNWSLKRSAAAVATQGRVFNTGNEVAHRGSFGHSSKAQWRCERVDVLLVAVRQSLRPTAGGQVGMVGQ